VSSESERTAAAETARASGALDDAVAADNAVIEDLLVKTSRTFALAIPLLPEPTCSEVTIGYLLFRIADTFEDASVHWERAEQRRALAEFIALLEAPSEEKAAELVPGWIEPAPSDHEGYVELLRETPRVMRALSRLSPEARGVVAGHTIRTAELMSSFVDRSDSEGDLHLGDLQELRDYCYAVAGIVGEMLTDLFVLGTTSLEPTRSYLRERAAEFGEGLQLVNILKDSASDATEGRFYLPERIERDDVFALAHQDLHRAAEYVLRIQQSGGPDGVVAFTALPVELARASLHRVESEGPGAKLTRPEVFEIYEQVHSAIAEQRPALPI
jgi:farnesyl-diphosphate farnesyltransferase